MIFSVGADNVIFDVVLLLIILLFNHVDNSGYS